MPEQFKIKQYHTQRDLFKTKGFSSFLSQLGEYVSRWSLYPHGSWYTAVAEVSTLTQLDNEWIQMLVVTPKICIMEVTISFNFSVNSCEDWKLEMIYKWEITFWYITDHTILNYRLQNPFTNPFWTLTLWNSF